MIVLEANEKNFQLIFAEAKRSKRPVIFPTDTIFGIGAPLSCVTANEKIFQIKRRNADTPLPILAGSWEQAELIAETRNLDDEKTQFIKLNQNKPVTYILNTKPQLNKIYAKNGTVAIRIPTLDWLRNGLILLNEPVTATSVNVSKQPNAKNFLEAFEMFKDEVSLFLKNMNEADVSSKIYDLTGENIKQIR